MVDIDDGALWEVHDVSLGAVGRILAINITRLKNYYVVITKKVSGL